MRSDPPVWRSLLTVPVNYARKVIAQDDEAIKAREIKTKDALTA